MNHLRGQAPKEKTITNHFKKRAKEFGWLVIKLSDRFTKGLPDAVIIKAGKTVWVELKRPKGKPRPEQVAWSKKLKAVGAEWHCLDTKEKIEQFFLDH